MTDKESEVLSMLQPDLLTKDELIQKIQSRCCRIENLGLMSKDGLVGLFRRVILPLPQRFYRANRRGEMLTSRRTKAGLEGKRKERGYLSEETKVPSESGGRLKPPPDVSKSYKIRISSDEKNDKKKVASSDVGINETNKLNEKGKDEGRKIILKRSSANETSSHSTGNKRQRTAIKWPSCMNAEEAPRTE